MWLWSPKSKMTYSSSYSCGKLASTIRPSNEIYDNYIYANSRQYLFKCGVDGTTILVPKTDNLPSNGIPILGCCYTYF